MRGYLAVLFFELGVLVMTLPLFGDEQRVHRIDAVEVPQNALAVIAEIVRHRRVS